MKARSRKPARPPGLVGPPPRFDHEREPFDPEGPLSSAEWYAAEQARFKAAHAAYTAADAAWSRHASDVLGIEISGFDALLAENADEIWPEWSVIPADVRHHCITETSKESA